MTFAIAYQIVFRSYSGPNPNFHREATPVWASVTHSTGMQ